MATNARLRAAAAPLWYWMQERHRIYDRRSDGVPQAKWTKDPILRTFRFCNVYRELDTTTMWIKRNWREPMAQHRDLWFAMLVARMINHMPTMEMLTHEVGEPRITATWLNGCEKLLKHFVDTDKQVYGAAYIITAGGQSGPKYKFTMKCLRAAANNPPSFARHVGNTLESMWQQIRQLPGCGNFIAYEIVTDLRWTRHYSSHLDHMTWGNPGPGAVRGLNRIVTGEAKKPIGNRELYIELMARLTGIANAHPKLTWMPRFEVRDIEHSLCETDKYLRAKLGEGRPKQLYRVQDK